MISIAKTNDGGGKSDYLVLRARAFQHEADGNKGINYD